MADNRHRFRSEILAIRVESGRLIAPENLGSKIQNMYLTEEGTLRAVWGPAPYSPNYTGVFPLAYNEMHGIFHARLWGGEREVLLIQSGDTIQVFEGWTAGSPAPAPWRVLLGPGGSSPQRPTHIESDRRARFPTQFEETPAGIVIIPKGEGSRPYFYDGREILPLGYSQAPSPPIGLGPNNDGDMVDETALILENLVDVRDSNNNGYSHPGYSTHKHFRRGRIGTINLASAVDAGYGGRLSNGMWTAATQWVDRWGNLSPLSGPSQAVSIQAETEAMMDDSGSTVAVNIDTRMHQFYWKNVMPGPKGTVGRILHRTRDMIAEGDQLYEMPANAEYGTLAIATLPDNVCTAMPDNVPDSWLSNPAVDVVPVEPFKLYKVAFGRGWAANFQHQPGKLHPTMPGRWGTFEKNKHIYPDPKAGAITGLFAAAGGLLVFTESSTYIITPFDSADGFKSQTLHPSVGCVAPSSIAAMPDGSVIWLGREGFYKFEGEMPILISAAIARELRNINRGRMVQACATVDPKEQKYRCWVAMDGGRRNDVCWEWDGDGWSRRTDVEAAAVCVSSDHCRHMLVAGRASRSLALFGGKREEGVWLLDHEVQSYEPESRPAIIETPWLRSIRSKAERGSPLTVFLWLRETESGVMTIEVQRDWRNTTIHTAEVSLHPQDDFPGFWGDTTDTAAAYNGTNVAGDTHTWKRRRPYWIRADLHIPSAETFRLKITHTGDWEFLGMAIDEVPHSDTFRSAPK